jgi:ClpP class serine protease
MTKRTRTARRPPLNVLQFLTQTRWAMHRPALEQMLEVAQRDIGGILSQGLEHRARAGTQEDIRDAEDEWDVIRSRRALFTAPATAHPKSERLGVRDGVGILPIVGPMCRYASWFQEVCGMTSTQLAVMDLRIALEDPSIRAILICFDTPGGEVNGTAEFAQYIFEARGRKPIVGMVSDGAASAGYWGAAACDEIVVTPAAYVGSIGVYFELYDDTEFLAEHGFRRIRIVSPQSPNKVPDPDDPAGMAVLLREASEFADAFTESAAMYRGLTVEQLIAAGDGGAVFIGRHAVERGLADRVSTTEAVLAELATRDLSQWAPERAAAIHHPESIMSKATKAATPAATITPAPRANDAPADDKEKEKDDASTGAAPATTADDEEKDEEETEDAPAAVKAAFPKASAAIATEAKAAERARITGILSLPGSASQGALVQACIADPACTRADAAEKLLAARPVTQTARLEAFFAVTKESAPGPSSGTGTEPDAASRILATREQFRGKPRHN